MNTAHDPRLNGLAMDHAALRLKRRNGRRWILIPLGLIVAQMSLVISMVWVATADPSFAVEPNYYDKALAWDATAAQRRVNEQLGWLTSASAVRGPSGAAQLTFTLTNSERLGLDGAEVRVEMFASTRAADRSAIALEARGHGVYTADAAMTRPGLWECRFNVKRGPEVFTAKHQIEIQEMEHTQ